ncbi:MAG: hypothetical protein IKG40_04235 [Bacilli bacterium]|nr:hypothetical protein [Bacilli bacterium]
MKNNKIVIITMIITILTTNFLIYLFVNNGAIDKNRINFYDKLAESLTNGKLYVLEKVDEKLNKLSNPYDPTERIKNSVHYLNDYSFYKNHYYVYFGIVPVLTTYLPYKILTNHRLSYHAVQIFITFFIIGLFLLLKKIKEIFFKDVPLIVYLLFCVSISLISTWNIIKEPSSYCVAILSSIGFAVWSIYFWFKACFDDTSEKKELLYLTIGNLLCALVFGCRPTIGFFGFLFIPVLIIIFKKREINLKRVIRILLTLLPYIIVFGLLFLYNYLRFDSFFEFGKTYQLTLYDPTSYDWSKGFGKKIIDVFMFLTFKYNGDKFGSNGLFIMFPVLFLNFLILKKQTRESLKENKMLLFTIVIFISCMTIGVLDNVFNFRLIQRYRMDVCWLMGLGAFICSLMFRNTIKNKQIYDMILCALNIITIIVFIMLMLVSLRIIQI